MLDLVKISSCGGNNDLRLFVISARLPLKNKVRINIIKIPLEDAAEELTAVQVTKDPGAREGVTIPDAVVTIMTGTSGTILGLLRICPRHL